MKLPNTTTDSDFVENAADHLKQIKKTDRATAVLSKGKITAMLVNAKRYEQLEEAEELLDSLRAIEQSRKDFAAGRWLTVDELKQFLQTGKTPDYKGRKKINL